MEQAGRCRGRLSPLGRGRDGPERGRVRARRPRARVSSWSAGRARRPKSLAARSEARGPPRARRARARWARRPARGRGGTTSPGPTCATSSWGWGYSSRRSRRRRPGAACRSSTPPSATLCAALWRRGDRRARHVPRVAPLPVGRVALLLVLRPPGARSGARAVAAAKAAACDAIVAHGGTLTHHHADRTRPRAVDDSGGRRGGGGSAASAEADARPRRDHESGKLLPQRAGLSAAHERDQVLGLVLGRVDRAGRLDLLLDQVARDAGVYDPRPSAGLAP